MRERPQSAKTPAVMDENAQPVHNPHDRFFKETFSHPVAAREFFQACLPPRLVEASDWSSLELSPNTFIDERLTERSSDLLYSVRLRGRPAFIYCLFEHQSRVDSDMPFRLLLYMVRIWEQWRKQRQPGETPPCIVPLVLHQGAEPWTVSPRFMDWLAVPEELKPELGRFQPDFEHALFDLSQSSLEELRLQTTAGLSLSLMKAAIERKMAQWMIEKGGELAELLTSVDGPEFFRMLMYYALAVEDPGTSTVEGFAARIKDKRIREQVMSIAEQLLQKGRQEGLQEGRQEGLQEGLHRGKIQLCQQLLGLPVMSEEKLDELSTSAQHELLRELQVRLQNRLRER